MIVHLGLVKLPFCFDSLFHVLIYLQLAETVTWHEKDIFTFRLIGRTSFEV